MGYKAHFKDGIRVDGDIIGSDGQPIGSVGGEGLDLAVRRYAQGFPPIWLPFNNHLRTGDGRWDTWGGGADSGFPGAAGTNFVSWQPVDDPSTNNTSEYRVNIWEVSPEDIAAWISADVLVDASPASAVFIGTVTVGEVWNLSGDPTEHPSFIAV